MFLDSFYNGVHYRHNFKCLKDNEVHNSTFHAIFYDGKGLKCCKRLSLKEVKERSLKNGFEFLDDDYKGSIYKHNFKCLKDNEIHKSNFPNINTGYGLSCCRKRKLSGENNHSWNFDVTERDRIERKRNNYKSKRCNKNVDIRDKRICRKCGSKNNINRHHIKPWGYYPKLRYDINNIITFCRKCHEDFHIKFGRYKYSWKNLDKFILTK